MPKRLRDVERITKPRSGLASLSDALICSSQFTSYSSSFLSDEALICTDLIGYRGSPQSYSGRVALEDEFNEALTAYRNAQSKSKEVRLRINEAIVCDERAGYLANEIIGDPQKVAYRALLDDRDSMQDEIERLNGVILEYKNKLVDRRIESRENFENLGYCAKRLSKTSS